jgi:hypothetical protein
MQPSEATDLDDVFRNVLKPGCIRENQPGFLRILRKEGR